jgi:hypothetical protein
MHDTSSTKPLKEAQGACRRSRISSKTLRSFSEAVMIHQVKRLLSLQHMPGVAVGTPEEGFNCSTKLTMGIPLQ